MISVCIAAYNGERFIEKQLNSILKQTRKVDEVIICDDISSDNTVKVCEDFIENNKLENWTVYKNETNLGYCLNFYGAIEKAKGDVIFLCDQDDEWYENKVEVMCRVLQENSNIKVLSSRYDVIDANSVIIENSNIPYLGEKFDGSLCEVTLDSLIGCSYIRGFATCFKAEIKTVLKPYDLKSMLSHDWFINSLGAITGKSMIINTKLCKYRYHDSNVSLSDMTRKTFLGNRQKRITGLKESVDAHAYLASEKFNISAKDKKSILKMIRTEKKRIKFLEKKNPLVWLFLLFELGSYKRYYKSLKGALRVWIGDFCYAYNINF